MSRASRGILMAFAVYWLVAALAPDALVRPSALVLDAAGSAVTLFSWVMIRNRSLDALLGVAVILAAAGWISECRGRAAGFPFRVARGAVLLAAYFVFYCYAVIVILYVPYMDAWFPAAGAVVMAAAYLVETRLARRGRRAGRAPGAGGVFAGCAAVALTGGAVAAAAHRPGALWFSLFLAGLLFSDLAGEAWVRKRVLHLKTDGTRRPARRALTVLAAMCAVGMHTFLTAPPYFCGARVADPHVRAVYQHADAYDVVTTDRYLFATFKDGTLARVDKRAPGAARTVRPTAASLQRMAYDAARGRIYASVYKSNTPVLSFDENTLASRALVVTEPCAATYVALDARGSRLFFNCEAQGRITSVDLARDRIITRRQFPRPANMHAMAFDERSGRLYATPASLDPYVYVLNPDTLATEKRGWVGIVNQGLALHPERGAVYIAHMLGARILDVDAGALRTRASVPAGQLVRDVQPVGRCGLLAGDYAQATARLMDVCRGRTLRVWRVPPRVRGVWYDADTGRGYAATGCGVYELQMPRSAQSLQSGATR